MSNPEQAGREARIGALREAIKALEATHEPPSQLTGRAATQDMVDDRPDRAAHGQITYSGHPDEGEDWMERIPARYQDGENGFDRRLIKELDGVGVRCYTINSLVNMRNNPRAFPIFIDWLTHLEDKVPGPESQHRQILRANLVSCLNDPSLRGRADVVDLMIDQLTRRPPLPGPAPDLAGYALARIATKNDFTRIAALIDTLPPEVPKGSLIEYLGKVKTPDARELALRYLDTMWTYFAIRALTAMKAVGVRDRIAPYQQDHNAVVRAEVRRALKRLPE